MNLNIKSSGFPLPGFYYQVDFLFPGSSTLPGIGEAGFQEISGIKAHLNFTKLGEDSGSGESGYTEIGSIGNPKQFPLGRTYENLILKRGLTTNTNLVAWFEDSMYNLQVRQLPILVSLLNTGDERGAKGFPIMCWLFHEAYPVSWEFSGFDAMQSQYIIETMEFRYSYYILINISNPLSLSNIMAFKKLKPIVSNMMKKFKPK